MIATPSSNALTRRINETVWRGPVSWASVNGVTLRPYQAEATHAIVDSIIRRAGRTFVVILPRQSGKNEVQAHLLAWLLFRFSKTGGRMVSVSPTFKPQVINAMDRIRINLERSPVTKNFKSSAGFVFKLGNSRIQFFSADPSAKVVGATADLLLSVDEAQDVDQSKFDKDFDPMTASTNATRVFWGTVWTSDTLLHRQMQIAKREQATDGIKRLFFYTADDIRSIVPAYGVHVDRVIKEKGRQHPLVKTQYFCEEIDAQVGMFNTGRRALMHGDQPEQIQPIPDHIYAMLVDVAGQDEALLNLDGMGNPGRDSTTLSIVDIDVTTIETLRAPTYRIVHRQAWQGESHPAILGRLKSYADIWKPLQIVIDATGVGEGLWGMLDKMFPTRVIPVKFTQQVKSEIGWNFLGIIETGRFHDCAPNDTVNIQYDKCQSEILPGPSKTLRWGVKDGTRGPDGLLVHDDHVLADSLVAILDPLSWSAKTDPRTIEGFDPLEYAREF